MLEGVIAGRLLPADKRNKTITPTVTCRDVCRTIDCNICKKVVAALSDYV